MNYYIPICKKVLLFIGEQACGCLIGWIAKIFIFIFISNSEGYCLRISVVMCESLVLIGNDLDASQQIFEFCYIASETQKCIFFAF